jgi:branched-chain amino acid transport system ATP-binding protein
LAKYAYLLETGKLVLSGLAEDLKKDEAVRRSYLGH